MPFAPPSPEDLVEEPSFTPPQPEDLVQEQPIPAIPSTPTGAYGTRFRPTSKGFSMPPLQESLLGISPEEIPSGAGTTAPALTIPISVAGKTAAGVAGYMTSPQGLSELGLAATPAAPLVFSKWAVDMARGGYNSAKDIVQELGGMAREALDKGIISANQLGPVPEGETLQDHIQSLSEKAANAALMTVGGLGAAGHALARGRALVTPKGVETVEPPSPPTEAVKTPSEPVPAPTSPVPEDLVKGAPSGDSGVPPPTALGEIHASSVRALEDGSLIGSDGEVIKPGEGIKLHFAGGPSDMPTPWTLVRAENYPSTVNYKLNPRVVVRSADGTERTYDKANIYSPSKAPPSGVSGEAPPTAPATVEANEVSPVAAGSPEPAITEPSPVTTVGQVRSVTTPVTEGGIVGMGGAEAGEIPETGAGGEKYGVAERIRAERAQAGQVEPVEPGKVQNTKQTIDAARAIVQKDPEAGPRILSTFEADPNKSTSTMGMAVVRAHGEALAAGARTIEEHYGTESSEYKAAKSVLDDWDQRSKKMQTEWSGQGHAQMGETDIDTGSFTGLNRAYREQSGKDLPAAKKPRAKKIASEAKAAADAVTKAAQYISDRIKRMASNAEQRALDAASKTVREADIRIAQAETKARIADQELKNAVNKVRADAEKRAIDAANRTVREAAVRLAQAETKARVARSVSERDAANAEVKAARDALNAANKTVRNAAVLKAEAENRARVREAARNKRNAENERADAAMKKAKADREVREAAIKAAAEERRRLADPSIPVWEAAKKYLDENKGIYKFDDLRNKIAVDLKMTPGQVTKWMSKDAATKRLATDLWIKQRNARRLKEQAKIWLRELDTPGYEKALRSIPNGMFALSVFGHGFVALGTHAPIVAFQPRFWNAYVRNFGKMYKMVFSPAYYEQQMQDLVRRPNYDIAREAGLQNDPFKYEEYNTTFVKDLVKDWIGEKGMQRLANATGGGDRGYEVLKLLRQDMFDQRYDNIPKSIRVQNGVLDALADSVNHATGVTKKGAPVGSNLLLFAPRLAGSRVMWLGGDPVRAARAIAKWKNASQAEKQFAVDQMREKGWVFGTFVSLLAANQGFLSATGSDQKINGIPGIGAGFDPLAPDFLKFKVAGMNVAYGGALLTLAKLPARVAMAILYEGKGSKYVLENERVDKVVGEYLRTQAAPFTGTLVDLAYGRDYQERPLPAKMFGTVEQTGKVPKRLRREGVEPYTWLEYGSTHLPIPVAEGIKEGLKGSGMNDEQTKYWLKALAIVSLMTGTGTRITEDTREE